MLLCRRVSWFEKKGVTTISSRSRQIALRGDLEQTLDQNRRTRGCLKSSKTYVRCAAGSEFSTETLTAVSCPSAKLSSALGGLWMEGAVAIGSESACVAAGRDVEEVFLFLEGRTFSVWSEDSVRSGSVRSRCGSVCTGCVEAEGGSTVSLAYFNLRPIRFHAGTCGCCPFATAITRSLHFGLVAQKVAAT